MGKEWKSFIGGDGSGNGNDWRTDNYSYGISVEPGAKLLRTRAFFNLHIFLRQNTGAPALQWDPSWYGQGLTTINIAVGWQDTGSGIWAGRYPSINGDVYHNDFAIYQPCTPGLSSNLYTTPAGLSQVVQMGPGPDVCVESFSQHDFSKTTAGGIFVVWGAPEDAYGFMHDPGRVNFSGYMAGGVSLYCLIDTP